MKSTTKLQKFALGTFLIYMLVLVWVITLKCNMEFSIFMSRATLEEMTLAERAEWTFCHFRFNGDGPIYSKDAIEDMVVNVILFLTVGATLSIVLDKKKYITPLLGFLISLAFETVQFFTAIGGFAYIDLITNTLGSIIGMILAQALLKVIKPELATKILVVLQVIFSIIVIYGTINTINHIEIYL